MRAVLPAVSVIAALLTGLAVDGLDALRSSRGFGAAPRAALFQTTETPTGTASATGTSAATVTAPSTATVTATSTSEISVTLTVTATSPVTATSTVTATATPSATTGATPTELASGTPAFPPPAPVVLPYLSNGSSHEDKPPRMWGLQFQLEFLPEHFTEDVIVELPRARAAGVGSVRTNLYWELVEPVNASPAAFDWSDSDRRLGGYSAAGVDLLVTLVGYPGWAARYGCGGGLLPGMESEWREFVHAVAERYGEGYNVGAWEIGNEPDGTTRLSPDDWDRPPGWGHGEPSPPHGGCWGEMPAEYARFLTVAAEEIRKVDPDAKVTYGGLAYQDWADSFQMDFIGEILAAGAGPAIDFHNYHSFAHLWIIPGQPSGTEKHESFMARLKPFGEESKPVWITESYRATYDPDPNSPALQIPYLTRDLVELLAYPEIARVYWYAWVDTPSDIGDGARIGRGIIWPDRTPKPAFDILPYTIDFTNGTPRDVSDADTRIIEFSRPRVARRTYVAWSRDGGPRTFSVPVPSGWSAETWRFSVDDVLAGEWGSTPLHLDGGQALVTVGADAVFVDVAAPRRAGPSGRESVPTARFAATSKGF